ncbi:hypothetical protein GXN76_01560 [Kroppenstedtia pulmonis]|uniref:Uncharacterized protein n=1 Tax=Kroppenstedtia pulmonis TaxID=1380685 RepID=A0A7D3XHK1_9BACL|nr:hypothetical protein [Kroppenstedtia pulmonis]QKG83279.1 hypothetical protein GXN76_01560 [Kroppenstedtia pulmonis]
MNQKEKKKILNRLSPRKRSIRRIIRLLYIMDKEQWRDFRLASRCSLVEHKLVFFDLDKNNEYHSLFRRLEKEFQEHLSRIQPVRRTTKNKKRYRLRIVDAWIYYGIAMVLGILVGIMLR